MDLRRNWSAALVIKVGYSGLSFMSAVIMARLAGPEQFGIYVYVLSLVTLLSVFAKVGMDSVVPRFAATYIHAGDVARLSGVSTFSSLAILGSASALYVLALVIVWIATKPQDALFVSFAIGLLLVPINSLMLPFSGILMGKQRVVSAQVSGLIVQPVLLLLAVLCLWLASPSLSANELLGSAVFASTVALFVAAKLALRNFPRLLREIKIYDCKVWLTSALPVMLAGALYVANANVDILLLGSLATPKEAAIYKASSRTAELVVFVLIAVNLPLAPAVARLRAAGDEANLRRTLRVAARTSLAGGALVAGILAFSGERVLAMFGPEFVEGYGALLVLCAAQAVNLASGSASVFLPAVGRERGLLLCGVVAAVVNFTANLALIPRFGIYGAAIASFLSMSAWTVSLIYCCLRFERIDPTILGLRMRKPDPCTPA